MVKMNRLKSTVKFYSHFGNFTVEISKLHYLNPESDCNFEIVTVTMQKVTVNVYSWLELVHHHHSKIQLTITGVYRERGMNENVTPAFETLAENPGSKRMCKRSATRKVI